MLHIIYSGLVEGYNTIVGWYLVGSKPFFFRIYSRYVPAWEGIVINPPIGKYLPLAWQPTTTLRLKPN